MSRIVFAAYGVTGELAVEDPALADRARGVLPPGWTQGDDADVRARFVLTAGGTVTADGEPVGEADRPDQALGTLDAAIRSRVSVLSPDYVFVHAGVVAVGERALVIPGRTHTGKTTLVAALLEAGARYCSDEYAVVDADGLVHPYPRPLSLRRGPGGAQEEVPVEQLGAVAQASALPIAVLAVTRFLPGTRWAPVEETPAQGAMALLMNTIPARERPREVLATVRRAADGARVLSGVRGEAAPTAQMLLDALRA